MSTEELKNVIRTVGGDTSELPDNLKSTLLQKLCETLGIDTSDMGDKLYNSYLKKIINEYAGGGDVKTYADQLYEFYGVDKEVYPYICFCYRPDSNASSNLYFSNTQVIDKPQAMNCMYCAVNWLAGVSDFEDLASVVEKITTSITTLNALSFNGYVLDKESEASNNVKIYTNYALELKYVPVYRLD